MNGHLASIAALASLWLALIALVALVTRILWPWVARASRGWDPEDRARVAFLAAVAPVLVPSAVVVLCALPGIAGLLTGAGDHCIGHGDHPHFCPVHATLAMTPLLGVAFAGSTALIITLSVLGRWTEGIERGHPFRIAATLGVEIREDESIFSR